MVRTSNLNIEICCFKDRPSNCTADALSNHTISLEGVSPCSHEEADTRICVDARHAAQEGSKSLLVNASDTDIIVIAISAMPTLQAIGLQQLWIAFGQGRTMRWILAHELYRSIGHEKGRVITSFHAFTGYDVVSAFRGNASLTLWRIYGEWAYECSSP